MTVWASMARTTTASATTAASSRTRRRPRQCDAAGRLRAVHAADRSGYALTRPPGYKAGKPGSSAAVRHHARWHRSAPRTRPTDDLALRTPVVGLGLVLLVAILIAGKTGGDDKYVVYASSSDAGGILKNYNVKIGSVAAGKVAEIRWRQGQHGRRKMELDKGAAPIGAGASAKVRPVNLLGEKYIDLDPGDRRQPAAVRLDDPADQDRGPGRARRGHQHPGPGHARGAMRILINEAGIAMAGRGTDFNQTLDELPARARQPRARSSTEVADENKSLEQRDRQRRPRHRRDRRAARRLRRVRRQRRPTRCRPWPIAARKLGETVRAAPAGDRPAARDAVALQAASEQLTPAARDLRATTPALATTLKRSPQFANDANATLATATRVAPALKLGRPQHADAQAACGRPPSAWRRSPTSPSRSSTRSAQAGLRSTFISFMNGWARRHGQRRRRSATSSVCGVTFDDESPDVRDSKFAPICR